MPGEGVVTLALPGQAVDIDVAGIVSATMYIRRLEDLRNRCLSAVCKCRNGRRPA